MAIQDGSARFEVRKETPTMLGATINLGNCVGKPVSWLKEQIIATAAKTPIGHTSTVAGYNIGVMKLINVWNDDRATIPDGSHVMFVITGAIKASTGLFANVMLYSYGINGCGTFNILDGKCSSIGLIPLSDAPTNLLTPINKTLSVDQPTRLTTANRLPKGNGGGVECLIATDSMKEAKPPSDGFILHFGWDYANNYDAQLFIPNNTTARIAYRPQAGDSTWSRYDWSNYQLAYLSDVSALRDKIALLESRVAKLE